MSLNLIPYLGGKTRLAKTIVSKIPEHTCYAEVFGGGGDILFKKEPSQAEVINDINKDLVTLYRVVQHHLEEFLRYFKWALISRDEFQRQLKCDPETLTDIQRAARFFYLQKTGFGGKVTGRTFGYSPKGKPRLNLIRLEEDLSEIHLRLARVTIENLHYSDVLKRYDRDSTFFYLDPPYHKVEDYYGKGIFAEDDFLKLSDILSGLKGTFMLSINDTPFIRDVFKNFKQEEIRVTYTVCKDANKRVKELLISNY